MRTRQDFAFVAFVFVALRAVLEIRTIRAHCTSLQELNFPISFKLYAHWISLQPIRDRCTTSHMRCSLLQNCKEPSQQLSLLLAPFFFWDRWHAFLFTDVGRRFFSRRRLLPPTRETRHPQPFTWDTPL